MSCQDYEIALGDYVDGTLDERSRVELEIASRVVRALPGGRRRFERHPSGDVWRSTRNCRPPHVWTRLSEAFEAERGSTFRGWGFTWQTLAASLVTVTLVASLAWVGNGLAPIKAPSGRLASATPNQVEAISVKAEFELAEAQYTSAIAGLESITKSEQSALDMDTADVLQANLTVIDGAITESRAALQTEPDNPAAQESLFDALRSKLELLQDVVALINEMRKGNPEGAARIVSGLNQ